VVEPGRLFRRGVPARRATIAARRASRRRVSSSETRSGPAGEADREDPPGAEQVPIISIDDESE
jgi:hypothetical protein